jgi:hypothetical protein
MVFLMAFLVLSCSQTKQNIREKDDGLVSFASPWTSVFRADPLYPHQLVNNEGEHLLILNKTAWAYFTCADPEGVLQRAKAQGVNVIRVCLEGTPYFDVLKMDGWPWGGTRDEPDFTQFNETYWNEAEHRVRMAGEYGIGIDLNIYFTLGKQAENLPGQEKYWANTIERLGKYANILTWEIMNEYLGSESFQDSVGWYFYRNDPWQRPVITSDGTTDDAAWPEKAWMGMAIVHTCTGSTENHDLNDWYLAVARNTRSHGKPAFNNESGRETRHKNDDPVHRRKQAWIWYAAGCHWTWHSWEGCEGIDDPGYKGPGQEFMLPVTTFFRSLPFWKMEPNFTVLQVKAPGMFAVTLAEPSRKTTIAYLCTDQTGMEVTGTSAKIRLPNGSYQISFIDPVTLKVLQADEIQSKNLGKLYDLQIPDFTDDLVVKIENTIHQERTIIKGTE